MGHKELDTTEWLNWTENRQIHRKRKYISGFQHLGVDGDSECGVTAIVCEFYFNKEFIKLKNKTNKTTHKSLQAISAGEDVEKKEPSYTVGGSANLYSHYGEQRGDSLQNWK